MAKQTILQLANSLTRLKQQWPKPMLKEVSKLFEQLERSLKSDFAESTFAFVPLVQQVLKVFDILFLNRNLSYHVVATSDLPKAYGSEEEATAVLTELIGATARHAGFGSRLAIHMQKVSLRSGGAIQTRLCYEGKVLSDLDRQKLLAEIYGPADKPTETSALAYAKMVLRRAGGQFWLEFPKETVVALTFNWPAHPVSGTKLETHSDTYKYDIWLTDFNKLRQRFGIPKANKLVTQIEDFLRSLVRHPMDIVLAFPSRGMITAIYESQEGTASSVAARISGRLKKEKFRIGKKSVLPKFRYQLTFLA